MPAHADVSFAKRTVVVAAGVVDVPAAESANRSFVAREPIRHRDAIQRRWLRATLHRDGELAGGAKLGHHSLKRRYCAMSCWVAIFRLDAFLPTAVDEQALLRGEAQRAIVPFAVVQQPEFFEQLARQRFALGRHRHIVRRPWEPADLVFAPTRIAAGLGFHLEQHEIAKAALVEMPGGVEARHAAADDHDRNSLLPFRRGERRRDRAAGGPGETSRARSCLRSAGRVLRASPSSAGALARTCRRGYLCDVFPFLLVVADQNLIVQPVRLGLHRQHVDGKYEQLADILRRQEIATRQATATAARTVSSSPMTKPHSPNDGTYT